MGIHICIVKADGTEHPDWDGIRCAGDREIPAIVFDIPHDQSCMFGDPDYETYRPTDFAAFRERLSVFDYNQTRWQQMADILENEPDYWLRFSY